MGLEQDPTSALLCLASPLAREMENTPGAYRLEVLLSDWHPVPRRGTAGEESLGPYEGEAWWTVCDLDFGHLHDEQ